MKILIHGRAFPVAMWRWFDWAFRDLGHEVFSVGPHQGGYIPWDGGMTFVTHIFPPDHETPEVDYPIKSLLEEIDFTPDVIIQAADTIYLTGKAPCLNVILKTDPHAVDYHPRLRYADHVFNMQDHYILPGETWIPYAYYKPLHKIMSQKRKLKHDVVFSGLQYDHRKEALEGMKKAGLNVLTTLGLIYEDYVEAYNGGLIAFNWSSKNDLPARFWEGLAMKRLMLTNIVPDMDKLGFKDGIHYVGFENVNDAVEKAKHYVEHPDEAMKIARAGYQRVKPHTYKARAQKMVKVIKGLL